MTAVSLKQYKKAYLQQFDVSGITGSDEEAFQIRFEHVLKSEGVLR